MIKNISTLVFASILLLYGQILYADNDPETTNYSFYNDMNVLYYLDELTEQTGIQDIVIRKPGIILLTYVTKKINSNATNNLEVILKAAHKYPKGFMKTLGVKKIVLTGSMTNIFTGKEMYGMYDSDSHKIFIDINTDTSNSEHVLHHEISHVIDYKFGHVDNWDEWLRLNPVKFKYGDWNKNFVTTCCLFSKYSYISDLEDRAETMAVVMSGDINKGTSNLEDIKDAMALVMGGPKVDECKGTDYLQRKFDKVIVTLNTVFKIQPGEKTYWSKDTENLTVELRQ